MRAIVIMLVLSAATLVANPIPVGDWAYISSEQLTVRLSPDTAAFNGVFSFRSTAPNGKLDKYMTGDISIPIWLPESKFADVKTRKLLDTFAGGGSQPLTDAMRPAWNDVIGITVKVGRKSIAISQYSFVAAAGSRHRKEVSPVYQRKGYCCLVVHVSIPPELISSGQKVTIAYKQPLHRSNQGLEFYYVPVFGGMPSSVTTTDLNKYCLTLQNETGMSLALGAVTIRQSASAVLPLAHYDAIAARTFSKP